MTLRLHVVEPLATGIELALPEDAARHVQVRRLQPGDSICLFDGRGGEWSADILEMGKRDVAVRVGAHDPIERGLGVDLEIAFGMPTNERMDALIEKATELGASAMHPLITARSVLRLDGERAARRVAHWQAVAVAACEQSGRTRVPRISPVTTFDAWLQRAGAERVAGAGVASGADPDRDATANSLGDASTDADGAAPVKFVLAPTATGSLADQRRLHAKARRHVALSGPEGGLDAAEIAAAVAAGYRPLSLGPLVLRADTAPLAWLAQAAALLST